MTDLWPQRAPETSFPGYLKALPIWRPECFRTTWINICRKAIMLNTVVQLGSQRIGYNKIFKSEGLQSIHNPIAGLCFGVNVQDNIFFEVLWCQEVKMFQWWSLGKFSLIFSILFRICKKEGLWFISAAQHFSTNLLT